MIHRPLAFMFNAWDQHQPFQDNASLVCGPCNALRGPWSCR